MIALAKQWTVSPSSLEAKTTEMIHNAILFTATAQHPPKQVKIDFYYMHCVNSSIFFPTFNALPWLSTPNKIRMLKFKAYIDLAMYASRRCPALLLNEIVDYKPRQKGDGWDGIIERLWKHDSEDDGHATKLGRAVAYGEQAMQGYEDADWAKIKGDMWVNIGKMVVDSVEDTGNTWVRSGKFISPQKFSSSLEDETHARPVWLVYISLLKPSLLLKFQSELSPNQLNSRV